MTMPTPEPSRERSPLETYPIATPTSDAGAGTFLIAVTCVGALYLAREVFVPLALAVLLSFALAPLVDFLRRYHLGRVPSVVATVLVAFLVIFGVGSLVTSQLARLVENLPQYQTNITDKIHSLQSITAGDGIVARATTILKDLNNEVSRQLPAQGIATPSAQQPMPVEIHQPAASSLQMVEAFIGPLLQPLTTTGIVAIFVFFFLLQREDLRDRFIRLAGVRDLQRTTHALDDAAHRLSRYLLVQTAINAGFGVLIGAGLFVIGVPNPLLWGILAMLLRFVPYIGAVIAAIFPAILALAVDPGWTMLLWTGVLFASVEPITGQVIEPLLYGRTTGLSAVAVVVAAVFWTWIWGPVGLLLSTPLTLSLVVLGRHVKRLEFLDIVLGDQPPLAPEESFYQRMLANDPDEAAHQAEEFLKEHTLATYYDEVAIRGLALAQLDVNRGATDHLHRVRIKEAVEGVIDDLADHVDVDPDKKESDSNKPPTPPETAPVTTWPLPPVLCVAGRGSLDEAAAAMLAQLLDKRLIGARVIGSEAVSAATIFRLDLTGVQIICLSYLEPGGFTNARYLVRRLRRKLPSVRIIVGLWTLTTDGAKEREALRETGADRVVTSLREGVDQVVSITNDIIRREMSNEKPIVEAPAAE